MQESKTPIVFYIIVAMLASFFQTLWIISTIKDSNESKDQKNS
ncbi:hypothetical protein [Pseudalkalibacillus caeni]|nr:hypothetical protein [Pseudalkalibacillus caeni]